MGHYDREPASPEKRPSIEIRLPIVVRYLEAPLNRLVLMLDEQVERMRDLDKRLEAIEAALKALTEPGEAAPPP